MCALLPDPLGLMLLPAACWLMLVLLPGTAEATAPAVELTNGLLIARIDGAANALLSLGTKTGAAPFAFRDDSWALTVAAADGEATTLAPANCSSAALVHQPTADAVTTAFTCDGGARVSFRVEATYRLAPGWHFLTRELRVCQLLGLASGRAPACYGDAKFTLIGASIWENMASTSTGVVGPHHNWNPYMTQPAYPGGDPGVVASFWRRPKHADGFFASVQNPFFASGTPPPPPPSPPPAPECVKDPKACQVQWVGKTWTTYNPVSGRDKSLPKLPSTSESLATRQRINLLPSANEPLHKYAALTTCVSVRASLC